MPDFGSNVIIAGLVAGQYEPTPPAPPTPTAPPPAPPVTAITPILGLGLNTTVIVVTGDAVVTVGSGVTVQRR